MYSLHELVHLVPHLGSGEVRGGGLGVLAGGPLDAGQLVKLARGVHDEAHAAGQLALLERGVVVGPPLAIVAEETAVGESEDAEAEEEDLEGDQDTQVGEVEGEDLGGGGGPGQELHGLFDERGSHICSWCPSFKTCKEEETSSKNAAAASQHAREKVFL